MPKILYGISPIGLGHATRSLVVIGQLAKAGAEVKVFSGGEAAEFLRGNGSEVADIVADTAPHVSKGKMTGASLWYLRSWLGHRNSLPKVRKLFDSFSPDLVVCDEEFTGISVAKERQAKGVFISDELELGFARTWLARKIEARVYSWYRQLQDSVDLLIIPDQGEDRGNRRFVGPITREARGGARETRAKHGLPADGQMVLLSLSGSGLGDFLIPRTVSAMGEPRIQGTFLAITGNRGEKVSSAGVYDLGVVNDNQDLVACADVVVSNAGKSTIDEAGASGTPIIAIPIRNHAEQERNAAALGYSSDDLSRLSQLIPERIGRRGAKVASAGAERAAQLMMSLIQTVRTEAR
jgi:UDP-N-acetylglucosamine--N-acetylmuramyl-(pentapeptide) pyrophosphoryl-undecaprenol N-acetylglucosamine transferase